MTGSRAGARPRSACWSLSAAAPEPADLDALRDGSSALSARRRGPRGDGGQHEDKEETLHVADVTPRGLRTLTRRWSTQEVRRTAAWAKPTRPLWSAPPSRRL